MAQRDRTLHQRALCKQTKERVAAAPSLFELVENGAAKDRGTGHGGGGLGERGLPSPPGRVALRDRL